MADAPKKVIVSSTFRDLPDHRQHVISAIQRSGMTPLFMEILPADPNDAIHVSLDLVNKADLYVGVFAHRYGYVPDGHAISVTEMEYNRARERNLNCYIFFMHDDHSVRAADVEMGEGAEKLKKLKEQLGKDHVVNFFKNPDDLRAQVLHSLLAERTSPTPTLHYISDIPAAPEPYIAHPYTLLQTKDLVGRQDELDLLTDWGTGKPPRFSQASILSIVAMGGMGKSALTWKWFNDIAPQEIKPLAGRVWWSFYESDAHFDNFVIRTLCYVSQRSLADVTAIPASERESQLLAILNTTPYLIVLDGLERLLIAYARSDAARMDDDIDEEMASFTASSQSEPLLPDAANTAGKKVVGPRSEIRKDWSYDNNYSASEMIRNRQRRKAANPRVGSFLRKLAQAKSSRILISTRLLPGDLQTDTDQVWPGSEAHELRGLRDQDAMNLWRQFGISGSRDVLLPFFQSFSNYPLLLRILAGQIARYRAAPGDFDRWRAANPSFNPFALNIKQVRTHVMEFALDGLEKAHRRALEMLAGFRNPATYDALVQLLVGDSKPFATSDGIDIALQDLEERGLVGWDRTANRYDMHPVVRGVTWSQLDDLDQLEIRAALWTFFDSFPKLYEYQVTSIDDLSPTIEGYDKLIGLGRFDDACELFEKWLEGASRYQLRACQKRIELLSMLFQDEACGITHPLKPARRAFALFALGESYCISGELKRGVPFLVQAIECFRSLEDWPRMVEALNYLAYSYGLSGQLRNAETQCLMSIQWARKIGIELEESISLMYLSYWLLWRGEVAAGEKAAHRSALMADELGQLSDRAVVLGNLAFQVGDYQPAYAHALQLLQFAPPNGFGVSAGLKNLGYAALELGKLQDAEENLNRALTQSRSGGDAKLELEAVLGLSRLCFRLGDMNQARSLIDEGFELAERGPMPIFGAELGNTLAEIELSEGNQQRAKFAATKAYVAAWCDGPPYCYLRGLNQAREHLNKLGIKPPTDLRPFDETQYEPLPKIEIDPPRTSKRVLPRGITNTQGWSDTQVEALLTEVKRKLDWDNTTGSARKWWEAFEAENPQRKPLQLRLAEELAIRETTITEFFLSCINSNTDNIQANLYYHDYRLLAKQEIAESTPDADILPPGISDTTGWSVEDFWQRLDDIKPSIIGDNADESAMQWWTAFEAEKRDQPQVVLRLAQELAVRGATISEYFQAYSAANTRNRQAALHYMDYLRKKTDEDRKKRRE